MPSATEFLDAPVEEAQKPSADSFLDEPPQAPAQQAAPPGYVGRGEFAADANRAEIISPEESARRLAASDQPLITGEQLPYKEGESPIVRGLKATQNVVNRFGVALTKPSSLAGILFPPLGLAQAATGIIQQPGEIKRAFTETPPGSPQRAEAVAGGALTLGMLLFGAKGLREGIIGAPVGDTTTLPPEAAALAERSVAPPLGETMAAPMLAPEVPLPVEPTAERITPSATQEGIKSEGYQPEHPGVPPGTNVPENVSEIRQIEGEQAGGGGGVEPSAQVAAETPQELAPAEQPKGETAPTAVQAEVPAPPIGKDVAKDIPDFPQGERVGLTQDYISKDRQERGEEPLAEAARKSNPETWDKATQVFAGNPNAGHELVASLIQNPRALTEDDLGVLLHHRVDLSNQTDFEYSRLTSEDATPQDRGEASVKLAALNDARNQADIVTSAGGTQAGRTMQFLQKMSAQDYSLSGLTQERRAALGGEELTPKQTAETAEYSKDILAKDAAWQNYLKENRQSESALKAYKTRLATATTDYERRIAFQEFEPQIRKQLELDPEAQELKADLMNAKGRWQQLLAKDQLSNRPMWQKILGGVAWGAREAALSGYHTLAKLAGFTAGRLVEIPLNQTAERVWGMIPGFKEIAAKSEFGPGANAQALGQLYSEFFTTGMKQASQQLRTGMSDLKATYGQEKIGLNYPSFFGNLHGAEKTPLLVGSTAMNRARIINKTMNDLAAKATSEGSDISDPIIQAAINKKAFDAGTYDILMEKNMFADRVNGLLNSMEAKSTKTGEVSIESNILATLAKTFVTKGIIKTPANFVVQALERTPLGLARGLARAGRALYKGVDNVTPGERTAIMRLLGTGSVGSAMFLWGVADALRSPDKRMFGGYFQPGEKRDENDVKFGSVRVGDHTAPHYFSHNLLTEPAQMGSTMMRVATSALSKKDRTNKGLVSGLVASTLGLAEQAPIANPAFRLGKLTQPSTQSNFLGDQVRGLIPQFVQNIAEDTDKAESRKATGILETTKLGIPGLREQVKERTPKASGDAYIQ